MNVLLLGAVLAVVAGLQSAQPPSAGQSPSEPSTPAPQATSEALAAMHKTCAADFKAKCPGMGLGSPELRACVQERFSNLSGECQAAIQAALAAGAGG